MKPVQRVYNVSSDYLSRNCIIKNFHSGLYSTSFKPHFSKFSLLSNLKALDRIDVHEKDIKVLKNASQQVPVLNLSSTPGPSKAKKRASLVKPLVQNKNQLALSQNVSQKDLTKICFFENIFSRLFFRKKSSK